MMYPLRANTLDSDPSWKTRVYSREFESSAS
jgi:hypothetical protein